MHATTISIHSMDLNSIILDVVDTNHHYLQVKYILQK
jgi:hypothetical protein